MIHVLTELKSPTLLTLEYSSARLLQNLSTSLQKKKSFTTINTAYSCFNIGNHDKITSISFLAILKTSHFSQDLHRVTMLCAESLS